MKKILFMCMSLCIVSLFSCGAQQSGNSGNGSETLPDGTVITAEEKSALEGLQPQVDQIFANVLGETRAKALSVEGSKETTSPDEIKQIDAQVKALVINTLGSNYEKFFVTKEITPVSVSQVELPKDSKFNSLAGNSQDVPLISLNSPMKNYANQLLNLQIGHTTTTHTVKISWDKTVYDYFDNNFYINIYITSIATPFYCYNTASQVTTYKYTCTSSDGGGTGYGSTYYQPSYQFISLGDEVTPYTGAGTVGHDNVYTVSFTGNLKMYHTFLGIPFPSPMRTMTTYHAVQSASVYNGFFGAAYVWSW